MVNNMGKAMLYYTGIDEANWYFRIGLAESRTVFDTVTVFDTIRVSVYDTVTVCDTVYVLGIKNEYYNQDLIVYPNPAKDLVTVEGNSQDLISLKVFNVHGQDCTEKTSILDQNNQSIVFDISHLPPGAYVIKSETAAVVLYKP